MIYIYIFETLDLLTARDIYKNKAHLSIPFSHRIFDLQPYRIVKSCSDFKSLYHAALLVQLLYDHFRSETPL